MLRRRPLRTERASFPARKRLVRTVLIFTESSDQLSRATDRVPGLPASPGYV
nr:AAA family ATPase [Escherichia coli]